ncbi:MAG: hypothetical protein KBA91_02075 [Candidatus Moranbacteria bacterium]|nr:hypothetical protein [Candidatus Moranbacteria bacterium]
MFRFVPQSADITRNNARVSLFVFFALLITSVTFYVSADDTASNKNIFQDSDQDGLSNDEEALYGTDPLNKDTDGDGYSDGVEVQSGYDPLKPAPGDRLVPVNADASVTSGSDVGDDHPNLTKQVSAEIAGMVQKGEGADGQQVSMDAISEAAQKVMDQSNQEIVLPEVNIDEIQIKPISKKLREQQKRDQEREDAVQYLTVISYILANNSPRTFHSETDFGSMMTTMGNDTLTAMISGNKQYLEEFSKRGEKTLKELKNIEVPEGMLEVHVKAVKMAKYSITLKDEASINGVDDPLGQLAAIGKVQGFFGVVADFSQEVYSKLNEYGIESIPLDP